ncbi:MAG TPA: type IX secretion system outer membrane channel protein PorV [Bacteroidales bacterium]|nr:type IX secretion system outer membrane channel protein PorV [Bacteroidales bacterium]HPR57581.1 type IX secretion system outer membrane channel protein PorV [Bacteroidales bacterium]HRW96144.1 type IX secretion system outer membrane channel protein PorV [Bacteroidales bacterium]
MINRTFAFIILSIAIASFAQAQKPNYLGQTNTITTAVPFLLIAPDARAGAMGDVGGATTPDANSMHWNPAKYAFIESKAGFAASYSPWLRAIVSDINLAYVAGYYKLDERQTIAASLLYFTLGDITFTDIQGSTIGNYRPNEFSLDGTYSRKFSETWSGAVAARYIHSNLTQGISVGGVATKPGQSIAADVSVYHQRELEWRNVEFAEFAFGVNISNIGSKISYSDATTETDFIPTNLRISPRLTVDLDEYNRLSFTFDVNKLLVPTPPIYATDDSGNPLYDNDGNRIIAAGKDPDVNVVQGMIQSWYDAPDGFEEELREFYYAVSAEYWYDKAFAVRSGFFYENKLKGNRQYFTLGAGLKYNVFGLDFSYLVPLEQRNPLENTLRFTLSFDFDDFYN